MLETCLTSAGHLVQKEDATGQCPHSSTVAWMVGWVGEVRDGGPMGRGATWGVGGPMGRGARWGSWWPAGDGGRTRSVRGTRGANGPGRILRGHADTRDEGVAGREGTVGWGTIGGAAGRHGERRRSVCDLTEWCGGGGEHPPIKRPPNCRQRGTENTTSWADTCTKSWTSECG